MGVYRVQESTSRDAIRPSTHTTCRIQWSGVTGSVAGAAVATNCITACIAEVRIVDSELSMVEDIKSFHAKLKKASFRDFEMLEQAHVEINPMRVVQEVSPRISER